ncbi:MAG: ribonuclease HII [Candidatus Omnitrophica bacterium]|nr:ribonuclease HII [Candidatus Omnitrophota bacterium]
MLYFERKFKKKGFTYIIGVDEAGRGPLAGPVVAAAAFLSTYRFRNRIDDSKKLTLLQRENAFQEIIHKSLFGIGIVNEKIIDRLNIAVASRIAMEEAIRTLMKKLPRCRQGDIHVLVDGTMRPRVDLSCTNIIRGDGRSKSIACASIIAKVTRDRIMFLYDAVYPRYGFLRHKGYPTRSHKLAIKKFGPSSIHRATFCSV